MIARSVNELINNLKRQVNEETVPEVAQAVGEIVKEDAEELSGVQMTVTVVDDVVTVAPVLETEEKIEEFVEMETKGNSPLAATTFRMHNRQRLIRKLKEKGIEGIA